MHKLSIWIFSPYIHVKGFFLPSNVGTVVCGLSVQATALGLFAKWQALMQAK
ncbi:hypothetical protein FDUTEX481_05047 [Tolypothrix sp. PCC 7601]|nr:hypothetical protein FDUTEX481_05047 [Tolypothrix sp. PCC 7601]